MKPTPALILALLASAATATAAEKPNVIGKWHLGLGEPGKGPDWNGEIKPGPLEIGFDHCFLLPTTNDRVPQVYLQASRGRRETQNPTRRRHRIRSQPLSPPCQSLGEGNASELQIQKSEGREQKTDGENQSLRIISTPAILAKLAMT